MKTLSNTQILILSIVACVMLGAMKAEEEKQEEIAIAQLKESIELEKQDKLAEKREFKRLYVEAQEKTGFPAKEKFVVNQ